MGENSKNIGEKGEAIVNDFLTLIGWKPNQKGIAINCVHKTKHEKSTHGIDFLYSYICPLHSETIENICISVKYSEDPYPIVKKTNHQQLKTIFKDHFKDLATTIECFKKSNARQDSNRNFTGVKRSKETGVLFWLNDHDSNVNTGIIEYLSAIRIDKNLVFDAIHIVDNKRINEITTALNFVRSEHDNKAKISFDYFNTGLNVAANNRQTNGTILPVQYISSKILPIRIEEETGQKIFQIISFEDFDIYSLQRILGLSQNYVLDYQMKTIVSFPDFNPTQKLLNQIENLKSSFSDTAFFDKVKINSYKPNHRNYDR